ncbi:class I SAM-dependent DNA methyltransferase [Limosilactobacillus oris]|uniref:class I SAM-dependent DNA methyltransferase n=1 Tax=Limosilactobacillus oris TaxID=1632 RepID=UPI001748E0E8|nr:class I SAM-dependent DNA methyltransferase [Limosilactobacillus oris]
MKKVEQQPIISNVDLRNDMAKNRTRSLIGKEQIEAAKRLVSSFHGDEVYSWKENQHRPDFLRNLFVDILGYTKTDSSNRKSDIVTFATEYTDETGKVPDGILGFFHAEDLDTGESKKISPVGFIEVEDSSYSFDEKKHDDGKGVDQAFDYATRFRNTSNHSRFEIVTNFVELRVYLDNRLDWVSIDLTNLTKSDNLETLFYLLAPQNIIPELSDEENAPVINLQKEITKKQELGLRISADKAAQMGRIHSKLISLGFTQDQADKMIVRLAFLMFADDTQIFNKPNIFSDFLASLLHINKQLRLDSLKRFFGAVDTEDDVLRKRLAPGVSYIDGGLFEGAENEQFSIYVKPLDDKLIKDLYSISQDDWSKVNPIVFGSMYEGAMDKSTRHEIGAHYTSEKNILRVINSLFMNDLRSEFENIKRSKVSVTSKLLAFKRKLSHLTFLDPACGSGNFLILAYRELRRLEHQVVSEILINTHQRVDIGFGLNDVTTLGFTRYGNLSADKNSKNWQPLIGVEVSQFNGIELGIPYETASGEIKYNSYPVDIARAGMWMMDHIMNQEFSETVVAGVPFVRIPLHKAANIVQGDALKLTWNNIVKLDKLNYILGNPPFKGGKTKKGKFEHPRLSIYFPKSSIKRLNNMDFVFGWFMKAAKATEFNKNIRVGFVASNSIAQGVQALNLEKLLSSHKLAIDFAYQTFKWDNNGAQVYVVIIGFNKENSIVEHKTKKLVDSNQKAFYVPRINEYLIEGNWIVLASRNKNPQLPPAELGSLFLDDGNYRISKEEYESLKSNDPQSAKYFHPFFGGQELLKQNTPKSYELYIPENESIDIKKLPNYIIQKLNSVSQFRQTVSKEDRKLSKNPEKYKRDRYRNREFLAIPRNTTSKRMIIPMRYISKEAVVSDQVYQIFDAPHWLFSILQSRLHYAWTQIISGSLGNGIRYSTETVYYKFPTPDLTETDKKILTESADEILAARSQLMKDGITLYRMYASNADLPQELKKAHEKNDALVDKLYGLTGENITQQERFSAVMNILP